MPKSEVLSGFEGDKKLFFKEKSTEQKEKSTEFREKSTELKEKGTVSEKKVRYFIKTEQQKSKVCRLALFQLNGKSNSSSSIPLSYCGRVLPSYSIRISSKGIPQVPIIICFSSKLFSLT